MTEKNDERRSHLTLCGGIMIPIDVNEFSTFERHVERAVLVEYQKIETSIQFPDGTMEPDDEAHEPRA